MTEIYEAFPEELQRVKKLTKEEIIAEQTRDAIDRITRVLNGEYENQDQK